MRAILRLPQWVQRTVVLALALLLFPALHLAARQQKKVHSVRKPAARRAVHSAHKSGRRHHHRYGSRRYRRKRRLARLHLRPERVKQIQQALIEAGYLRSEATGKWDDTTRDAMRRYQQENGFSVTGLPEAKPLMKLGLGPHSLPPNLDPTLAARGAIPAEATPNTSSTSSAASTEPAQADQ